MCLHPHPHLHRCLPLLRYCSAIQRLSQSNLCADCFGTDDTLSSPARRVYCSKQALSQASAKMMMMIMMSYIFCIKVWRDIQISYAAHMRRTVLAAAAAFG